MARNKKGTAGCSVPKNLILIQSRGGKKGREREESRSLYSRKKAISKGVPRILI